jgi:hypothetical protein
VKKTLILVILGLTLCSFGMPRAAHAQFTTGGAAGGFFVFRFAPTGISGDQQYLYVMAGGKILEYQLSDMTLLLSVDLPDPGAPPQVTTTPNASGSGQPPPPPPPLPHGLWAGNGSLYVLAGPFVYIYSVPNLALQSTVQLPKP